MGLLESLDVYPKKARVSGSKRRVNKTINAGRRRTLLLNFNDAKIFCTTRNNIRCRQFVVRSRTIYQKTEGVAERKKVKDNGNARECDEKIFFNRKHGCSWINHPNQQTRKKLEKKGDWKRTMLVNVMIRIFFFWKTNHDACEAIMRINKQQMKEVRK